MCFSQNEKCVFLKMRSSVFLKMRNSVVLTMRTSVVLTMRTSATLPPYIPGVSPIGRSYQKRPPSPPRARIADLGPSLAAWSWTTEIVPGRAFDGPASSNCSSCDHRRDMAYGRLPMSQRAALFASASFQLTRQAAIWASGSLLVGR